MARDRNGQGSHGGVLSIIGPGMQVVGDLLTDGALRIEGRVEGSIRAGSVVVGPEGSVEGSIRTRDAIVSGSVLGDMVVEARLEVHASAHIDGEVRALRLQLEDGAVLNGTLAMGPLEDPSRPLADGARSQRGPRPTAMDSASGPRAAAS